MKNGVLIKYNKEEDGLYYTSVHPTFVTEAISTYDNESVTPQSIAEFYRKIVLDGHIEHFANLDLLSRAVRLANSRGFIFRNKSGATFTLERFAPLAKRIIDAMETFPEPFELSYDDFLEFGLLSIMAPRFLRGANGNEIQYYDVVNADECGMKRKRSKYANLRCAY